MKKIFIKISTFVFLILGFFAISHANTGQTEDPRAACKGDKNCITSSSYIFPTSELVPGGTFKGKKDLDSRARQGLLKIIEKLMIPFGVLAIFIMTIGAGYMILHNGDDGMLNKGKKIFKMGIVAIAIALSSYLLVYLVSYLIYS